MSGGRSSVTKERASLKEAGIAYDASRTQVGFRTLRNATQRHPGSSARPLPLDHGVRPRGRLYSGPRRWFFLRLLTFFPFSRLWSGVLDEALALGDRPVH